MLCFQCNNVRGLRMHRLYYCFYLFFAVFFVGNNAMADVAGVDNTTTATFAGGCFWCMEPEFTGIEGVSKVVSGYTGGRVENPTYEEISFGNTGHVEAIQITYNPDKVTYQKLLDIFWSNVDPLDPNGQFCDKGEQYRAGIFYHTEQQQALAQVSLEEMIIKLGKPVATFIREAVIFYPAEDYHQEYYIKNKTRYKIYRNGCGRDKRLNEIKQKIVK